MLNKKYNNRKPDIWFESSDPNFDLFKFLGKINLHISKLSEENAENKGNNKAVTKLKELKRYAKHILPNYKK